jgi:hypothetical protein
VENVAKHGFHRMSIGQSEQDEIDGSRLSGPSIPVAGPQRAFRLGKGGFGDDPRGPSSVGYAARERERTARSAPTLSGHFSRFGEVRVPVETAWLCDGASRTRTGDLLGAITTRGRRLSFVRFAEGATASQTLTPALLGLVARSVDDFWPSKKDCGPFPRPHSSARWASTSSVSRDGEEAGVNPLRPVRPRLRSTAPESPFR